MIINIRGTSGAGKSRIVYDLMKKCGATEQIMDGETIVGYSLFRGTVAVVGRYATACGGCDTIKTQDGVRSRVLELYSGHRHVIFEGLLVSQIYARWAEFAAHVNATQDRYAWAQLDTPLDVCIARVANRRREAGNTKPFDPGNSLVPKWHSCQTNFQKATRDGLRPLWLDHLRATQQVLELCGISS